MSIVLVHYLCALSLLSRAFAAVFINIVDFYTLVPEKSFLDKTLLLVEYMRDDYERILVTAPRGFGKSTNMDMLKRFLEINIDMEEKRHKDFVKRASTSDSNREIILKPGDQLSRNCRLFRNNNLKIFTERLPLFAEHFGQYPVVFMDFQTLWGSSHAEVLESFRYILKKAYDRHRYLLRFNWLWEAEENKTAPFDKKTYKMYWNFTALQLLPEEELIQGFLSLPHVLHTRFRQKTVILIDEIDTPILNALTKNDNPEFQKSFSFIKVIMGHILNRGNEHVGRVVINAVSRLATILLPNNHSLIHYEFLHERTHSNFFGFSEQNVIELLQRFNAADKLQEITDWYNGHTVRGPGGGIKIYNSWSVQQYLDERKLNLKPYWIELAGFKHLKTLLSNNIELQNRVKQLVNGEIIAISNFKQMNMDHFRSLSLLFNCDHSYTGNTDLYLLFLAEYGYLDIIAEGDAFLSLKMPNNKEIVDDLKLAVREKEKKYYL